MLIRIKSCGECPAHEVRGNLPFTNKDGTGWNVKQTFRCKLGDTYPTNQVRLEGQDTIPPWCPLKEREAVKMCDTCGGHTFTWDEMNSITLCGCMTTPVSATVEDNPMG